APHYEHAVVGYNYRLSNLLAALGRAQLRSLPDKVARRRAINERYRAALACVPGLEFLPEAPYGRSSCWLTCITVEPGRFGATRADIRLTLEAEDIESRPLWKPMHLQPVYRDQPMCGGATAERLFATGLCLPSGSSLTESAQTRVIEAIADVRARASATAGRPGHVQAIRLGAPPLVPLSSPRGDRRADRRRGRRECVRVRVEVRWLAARLGRAELLANAPVAGRGPLAHVHPLQAVRGALALH